MPEKESEKFKGNFRTVVSLVIYIWQKEKRYGHRRFTGPQPFCDSITSRQDSGQLPPNPLIQVMKLYEEGLASYNFKWDLKFMMPWKFLWDFHVAQLPNAKLSQGMEKPLAWFATPRGYWLEGTGSRKLSGLS